MSNKPILKTPHHGTVADQKAIEAARECAMAVVFSGFVNPHVISKHLSLPQLFAIVEAATIVAQVKASYERRNTMSGDFETVELQSPEYPNLADALSAYHTAQKENRK